MLSCSRRMALGSAPDGLINSKAPRRRRSFLLLSRDDDPDNPGRVPRSERVQGGAIQCYQNSSLLRLSAYHASTSASALSGERPSRFFTSSFASM